MNITSNSSYFGTHLGLHRLLAVRVLRRVGGHDRARVLDDLAILEQELALDARFDLARGRQLGFALFDDFLWRELGIKKKTFLIVFSRIFCWFRKAICLFLRRKFK